MACYLGFRASDNPKYYFASIEHVKIYLDTDKMDAFVSGNDVNVTCLLAGLIGIAIYLIMKIFTISLVTRFTLCWHVIKRMAMR